MIKSSLRSGFGIRPILASSFAGLMLLATALTSQASVTYIGEAVIPGNGTDKSGLNGAILEDGASPNNGLNGFGSGLAYAGGNTFYGLGDRGPNKVAYTGGAAVDNTTSYPNRLQQFSITLTPVGSPDGSGHYSSYTVNATNTGTILFKNAQGVQYLGISTAFSTNPAVENHRLDTEAIRVAPDGTIWISDEYGPYILHFNSLGQEIGSLTVPSSFLISNPGPTATYEAANNTIGRTTNRGMEGLAITPDGKTLVGMMQSSLTQDGGLNGSNTRVLVYDLTNPGSTPKQYLYYFNTTATPISELLAINNHEFLVDERNGTAGTGGIKNLYKFDLNQASPPTDLTTSAYSGTTASNGLGTTYETTPPPGIVTLQKTLFANIGGILNTANTTISGGIFSNSNGGGAVLPDKIEGYAWGPDLPDGRHLLLATNDNDFTQPFNGTTYPAGTGYPNYIWAFAVDASDVPDFQPESFDPMTAASAIKHIIVVYQENWPFDGLYGSFPGANGISNATLASKAQIDRLTGSLLSSETGSNNFNRISQTGNTPNTPLVLTSNANSNPGTLNTPPQPLGSPSGTTVVDTRFNTNSADPNSALSVNTLAPYALPPAVNPTALTGDIVHRYWHEQFQIQGTNFSGGSDQEAGTPANTGFVTWSDNPGLVFSHFDATNLPEGLLAQQYTICDNFFHSAFGGSFLNHQFLVAAQAPVYNTMPGYVSSSNKGNSGNIAYLDSNGVLVMNTSGPSQGKQVQDGTITPVAGDQMLVTLNGTANTLVTGSAEAYFGSAGTTFDKHYVVNTTRSYNLPSGTDAFPTNVALLPSQNDSNPTNTGGDTRPYIQTIGDLLSANNISWKWYSGGWAMIAGYSPANTGTNPLYPALPSSGYAAANNTNQFQYHHQPLAYYDNFAPFGTNIVPSAYVGGFAGVGTGGLTAGQSGVTQAQNSAAHLQDETNFFTDVSNNTLPSVVFIKPVGINNEHPGYAALQTGQAHVASIVQTVQANQALWNSTLIIVTYDEHGGRWDHVTPPTRDIWGPGERVPCILISPLVQRGKVDHTQYDTSSILSTIEQKFGLTYLNSRDQNAPSLLNDLTSLNITPSGFTLNRRSNQMNQTVTITNVSGTAVTGPVNLVLGSLSSNTSLANKAGNTVSNSPGSPYVIAWSGTIAVGASVSVALDFTVPSSGGITYTPSIVTATSVP
jgi:acid phosphatase